MPCPLLDSAPDAVAMVSEAHELAIPVIVVGEFTFGIAQSRHREAYERSLAANAGTVHGPQYWNRDRKALRGHPAGIEGRG